MNSRTHLVLPALFCVALLSLARPVAGAVRLGSGSHPEIPQPGESQGDAFSPVLSADGRYVIFGSLADDLTTDAPDSALDVFRFDRQTGEMRLVSDVELPPYGRKGEVRRISTSADGGLVAYTAVSEIAPFGYPAPTVALVLRDLAGNAHSIPMDVVPDGDFSYYSWAHDLASTVNSSRVFFASRQPWINPDDTNYFAVLRYYVPGQQTPTNIWQPLPVLAGETIAPPLPNDAHIVATPDGRFAAWQLAITPFDTPSGKRLRDEILLYDAEAGTLTQVTTPAPSDADNFGDSSRPGISDNGRWVIFESRRTNLVSNDLNGPGRDVFLYDHLTQSTKLISTNLAGVSSVGGFSTSAAISGDGQWTAFFSDAPDLVPSDDNGTGDVFLRNNDSGEIKRISSHEEWHGLVVHNSLKPVISQNGEWVLYQAPGSGLFLYQRSLDTSVRITSDSESDPGSMTPDGRLVVFTAPANSINPASPTKARNVYLWDRDTGKTELISRRHPANNRALPDASTRLANDGVSDDGNRFVFLSAARNLIPNQPPAYEALWVRDIARGTNLLVGQYDNHYRSSGLRPFSEAVISGNGRYVAYLAQRTNLPPEGLALAAWDDLFVHDLETGIAHLVTASRTGLFAGSSNAFALSISTDGNRVAFLSHATNLTTDGSSPGVFMWDRATDTIRRMDARPGNEPARHDFWLARLSPDGNRIAFSASPEGHFDQILYVRSWDDPQPTEIELDGNVVELMWDTSGDRLAVIASIGFSFSRRPYHIDLSDNFSVTTPDLLESDAIGLSMDATGRYVAYLDKLYPVAATQRVWDVTTGELDTAPLAIFHLDVWPRSKVTAISSDGRFVVSRTTLRPQVTGSALAREEQLHLRLWDRVNDTITILDRDLYNDVPAALAPLKFTIPRNALRVIFSSSEPDAVPRDVNLARDVYFVDLISEDSDGDGMDDAWELAYFDTLDRDGSEDYDGDGLSDLAEFRAGTVPINSSSVLSVTDLRIPNTQERLISWRSVPGKRYIVQAKTFIQSTWFNRSDILTATASSTQFIDTPLFGPTLPSQRFYLVVLVE
jgi:Tol biopolymer transport system component